jgi:hypothetical protein
MDRIAHAQSHSTLHGFFFKKSFDRLSASDIFAVLCSPLLTFQITRPPAREADQIGNTSHRDCGKELASNLHCALPLADKKFHTQS